METVSEFGELLRQCRGAQGMSQLDLSLAAGVSSRHLSFIETGRSQPSRSLVLRLGETLALPLRSRNALLLAAGYAPAYPHRELSAGGLGPVRRALERLLESHEPFPAFVLDRGWNILLANAAHHALLGRLLPPGVALREPVNIVRVVLDPAMLRPRIANWPVVAHVLGHRLRRQLRTPGPGDELRRHLEALLAYPGVREAMEEEQASPESAVIVPVEIDADGQRLSWFSTIAAIGTPLDITVEEISIESLFPADEETERAVRALMASRAETVRARIGP